MGFHFFPPKLLFSDHVFDQDCCNSRVYELLIKDIIHAAVEGFNGLVFFLSFPFIWPKLSFELYTFPI